MLVFSRLSEDFWVVGLFVSSCGGIEYRFRERCLFIVELDMSLW